MTQTNRHMAVFTALLLCLALALPGCGSRNTNTLPPHLSGGEKVSEKGFTQDAQTTYDFLVYYDQMQRLQRHRAVGPHSSLTKGDVAEIALRAEEALNRLLEEAPTPQLYMEKAALYWNDPTGPARSRAALKDGLKKFPDNQFLTINLATSYVIDRRIDDAVDVMEDYLSRHKDDMIARERLGQMYLDADRNAEALDTLKAIPVKKRTADALYSMARAQGDLGMRKAAIANLKKAIAKDPGFTEARVELAYQYELAKDYVAAEKVYTSILGEGDPFPEARLRLINLNLKLNNPARAMELALDGPPSKAFILEAVTMFIDDEFFAQGSTVLDMLITNGQVPAEYYFYKAVIANEGEKDAEKALEYLGKVKETDRLYPHALRFKAQLFSTEGKDKEALEIARTGKKNFPQGTIFYILESSLLQRMDDNAGAEKALKDGLKVLKDNPELIYELGMLYEITDRRAEAMKLMESILRSHPDHTNALNYVGYTLAEENRDLARAMVLVQKASVQDPDNGFILDSVAWVYYRMGEFEKAWDNIKLAVKLVDKDPTIWEHYGDIAAKLGKKKEALKGYNYAIKNKSKHVEQIKKKLKEL